MAWVTEGVKNSPASGTLLADTGELTGAINATLVISASKHSTLIFQHRNATNNASVEEQVLSVLNSPISFKLENIPIDNSGERYRIITDGTTPDEIQASIFF